MPGPLLHINQSDLRLCIPVPGVHQVHICMLQWQAARPFAGCCSCGFGCGCALPSMLSCPMLSSGVLGL